MRSLYLSLPAALSIALFAFVKCGGGVVDFVPQAPPMAASHVVPGPTPVGAQGDVLRVAADVPAPSEATPEEPAPVVAVEPAPELVFDAEALVCGKISKEVAEELVRAVQHHYRNRIYFEGLEDRSAAQRDCFFAIWPELPGLIDSGKVQCQVWQLPVRQTDVGEGRAGYGYNVDDELMVACFTTPNWMVSFDMTREAGHPELFDVIKQRAFVEMGPRGR